MKPYVSSCNNNNNVLHGGQSQHIKVRKCVCKHRCTLFPHSHCLKGWRNFETEKFQFSLFGNRTPKISLLGIEPEKSNFLGIEPETLAQQALTLSLCHRSSQIHYVITYNLHVNGKLHVNLIIITLSSIFRLHP